MGTVQDILSVFCDIIANGILLVIPGGLIIMLIVKLTRRWPALLNNLVLSLLLALSLTPTVALHISHGPTGFPALIALLGRGPNGPEDITQLGVLPLLIAWSAIFRILWHRHRKNVRGSATDSKIQFP